MTIANDRRDVLCRMGIPEMTTSNEQSLIEELLRRLSAGGKEIPSGATTKEIESLETVAEVTLPVDLKRWLHMCNGVAIGQFGIFGVESTHPNLNIAAILKRHPTWNSKHWIPISSDGCGNYYLMVPYGEYWPVAFVEMIENPDDVAYVVASSLWRFLWFYIGEELGETRWPFDRLFVIEHDPQIIQCAELTLPWEA